MNMVGTVCSSFVTHEDTVIQQAAGRIAKWAGGANAAGSDEEAIKFMAAAYMFMGENIAYQTPPGGENETKFIQHVKYGRDVLKNRAGTCIDLAILYGSLCQAVGLEPLLYNIPGHCFPAVKLPVSGQVIALESTLIGKATFEQAVKQATETNMKKIRGGEMPYDEALISKYHKSGAIPMDLPGVGEDPLEKWGIKMPAAANQQGRGNAGQTADRNGGAMPAPANNESPLVGGWVAKFNTQGITVTGLAIFRADGGFEGKWINEFNGGKTESGDTGTWSINGNVITIKGDNTGTVERRIELKGDSMQMELKEMNVIVTWQKKK
jgi:hypothetical protein